jgi:hypothetical protein
MPSGGPRRESVFQNVALPFRDRIQFIVLEADAGFGENERNFEIAVDTGIGSTFRSPLSDKFIADLCMGGWWSALCQEVVERFLGVVLNAPQTHAV